MEMEIRNIIFDWSGTLVDDLPAVLHATNYVFERAGLRPFTLEQFRSEFTLPFEGFYNRFLPHVPLPQLEGWFHEKFREMQHTVEELPFARAFLEACRQRGIRMFLLSTLHPQHFEAQSQRNGFAAYLERPYLGIWDKRAKIHEVLAENRLDPAGTMFIGDMTHDVETARHGGIRSCAVLTGYQNAPQLAASVPDLLVEHLGELQSLLDRSGWRLSSATISPSSGSADTPVATVGALISDGKGRVLLVRTRKWSDRWGIPGGKIKRGETAEAALRRELLEETGLQIRDIRFVLVQDCIDSKEFYRPAHFLLLNYTCRGVRPLQVTLNHEAQSYRWVTLAEALALDLNVPTRRLIEAVQDHPVTRGRAGSNAPPPQRRPPARRTPIPRARQTPRRTLKPSRGGTG